MMDIAALQGTPHWVAEIVNAPATRVFARVLLTSAYWVSGFDKLFHWKAAIAEEKSFSLPAPALMAAITILVQLGGSALVISGIELWLGAGALGVFTLAAMCVAYPFWSAAPGKRMSLFIPFCEHLGLIAGFMLATLVSTLSI